MSALSQSFAAPIWMTYRQAGELNAHVRKGGLRRTTLSFATSCRIRCRLHCLPRQLWWCKHAAYGIGLTLRHVIPNWELPSYFRYLLGYLLKTSDFRDGGS